MVSEGQVGGVEGFNGSNVLPVAVKQVGLDVLAHGLRSWNDLAAKVICLHSAEILLAQGCHERHGRAMNLDDDWLSSNGVGLIIGLSGAHPKACCLLQTLFAEAKLAMSTLMSEDCLPQDI